ncbi:MAG: hypothetical protein WCF60_03735, partial [Anaerobacillus sp.]
SSAESIIQYKKETEDETLFFLLNSSNETVTIDQTLLPENPKIIMGEENLNHSALTLEGFVFTILSLR